MPRKSSKGKGGKKGGKAGKDPVTGRYMQETEDGRTFLVRDDGIYKTQASDNTITPLISIPPEVAGIHTGEPDSIMQFQFGDNAIVQTNSHGTLRQRNIYLGDFKYDKNGKLTSGRVDFRASIEEKPSDPAWVFGSIRKAQDTLYRSPNEWDNHLGDETWTNYGQIVEGYVPTEQELSEIRLFGAGRYFYNGWELDPFNPSIV
jgi:hypothetical protein